jgi:hypothetical protein
MHAASAFEAVVGRGCPNARACIAIASFRKRQAAPTYVLRSGELKREFELDGTHM